MSPDEHHTTTPGSKAQRPPPGLSSHWLDESDEEWPDRAPADDDEIVIGDEPIDPADPDPTAPLRRSILSGRRKGVPRRGRALMTPADAHPAPLTPEQRLLILDSWQRSGLPAGDFAPLVGVSKHTLYSWKNKFEAEGPAGLMDRPKGGPKGSRATELTKRAIIMMKETNPDWGVQKISDMLLRGPALPASPSTVAKVLHEWGYELVDQPTRPHPDKPRRFEKETPNQMWQTDLFTFMLKRQNQRVHLVGFMDDRSRFIVSYGLHASQSTALVIETLRAGIASYGAPQEILTDNGSQYVTWRGKSQFAHELTRRGIKHTVAKPRRPQTLGKIERFWGTLWRDCIESATFLDLGEARQRIGLFIDHYNFQRPHQGIGSAVPADRFFDAAPEVARTLKERVAANALELSRHGVPKAPFYLTGNVAGKPFSVHAEGERVILTRPDGREEISLTDPRIPELRASSGEPAAPAPPLPQPVSPVGIVSSGWNISEDERQPGTSPLDPLAFDEPTEGPSTVDGEPS